MRLAVLGALVWGLTLAALSIQDKRDFETLTLEVLGQANSRQNFRSFSKRRSSSFSDRATNKGEDNASSEFLFEEKKNKHLGANQAPHAASVLPHALEKRGADDDNVTFHQWNYPISAWGFVNKDLNYALTNQHELLVSNDSLMTFQLVPQVAQEDKCFAVYVSEGNTNYIFLLGEAASWVTRDAGQNWSRAPNPYRFSEFSFHPTQPEWGIARSTLSGSYTLYVTTNLGTTWTPTKASVNRFEWCVAAGKPQRICIIAWSNTANAAVFQYSDDFGKNWVVPLRESANFFRVHNLFLMLLTSSNKTSNLYVSSDSGTTLRKSLVPNGFPVGTLDETQFVEDDTGVIWVVVPTQGSGATSRKGNLYRSDSDGSLFALSLRDVFSVDDVWDFELVSSLTGTLISNQLVAEGKPPSLATVISFDNGDTWERLSAPPLDLNGQAYTCNGTCYLSLFGRTTWLNGVKPYGPLYSSRHAIGMLIGTGTVGEFDPQNINTYLSRDGGLSWQEIMRGSTIYEYGDYGGLIVLVDNQNPTDTLYYSVNGGNSFRSARIPETVRVVNIRVSSSKNERFILMARDALDSSVKKYWGVDFSKIHEADCQPSDYEEWHPRNGNRGPKCVLGRDITYRRRKFDLECFSVDHISQTVSVEPCNCTDNDYECDFNFERNSTTEKCAYQGTNLYADSIRGCTGGREQNFSVSSGYRKVPGDSCINDIAIYAPTYYPCNVTDGIPAETSSQIVVPVSISVLVLVFLLGLGIWVLFRGGVFSKKCPELFKAASDWAASHTSKKRHLPLSMEYQENFDDEPATLQINLESEDDDEDDLT